VVPPRDVIEKLKRLLETDKEPKWYKYEGWWDDDQCPLAMCMKYGKHSIHISPVFPTWLNVFSLGVLSYRLDLMFVWYYCEKQFKCNSHLLFVGPGRTEVVNGHLRGNISTCRMSYWHTVCIFELNVP
jgi:hypothetical protein